MKRTLIVFMLALSVLLGASANPGTRHEIALSLSEQAAAYYTDDYAPEALSALAGSASSRSDEAWGSPLCTALHALMNDTRTDLLNYADTLEAFSDTDCSGGSDGALRFYSDDFGAVTREWVWDYSRGNFYHAGAGQDLHHLRPAERQANIVRGSMCFGNVRDRYTNYSVWPETGAPVFWYLIDWNSGAGLVEPRDEIKGDVARILLYIWVCWGGENGENRNLWTDLSASGEGTDANEGLRVVEDADTLLEWMALDPVDSWELGRNDLVQSIQGNRNVFIDYPELAFLLLDREIPEMTTPTGWAHSCHCSFTAVADPQGGGNLSLTDGSLGSHKVSAVPNEGFRVDGFALSPAEAAAVTQAGDCFTVSKLREDCELTVFFVPTDPCLNGHLWNDGTETLAPSCETEGERTYTCTVCGACRTEAVSALGHDWDSQTIPPGCVHPGCILETCTRCGTERETPTDPALGHAWDKGTVTREATQELPGERIYRCTRCGLTRSEEIPFRFQDVNDESAYYFTPVYWALYHDPQITAGTGPTSFSPTQACTRVQVMTFLWNACGRQKPEEDQMPFTDIPENAYYFEPVLWAVEKGITSGTAPDRFSPKQRCTRAQIVTFLWHALGDPAPENDQALPFTDVPEDAYYRKALVWAVSRSVVAGTSQTEFSPALICTRAQVVTMLWRAFGE